MVEKSEEKMQRGGIEWMSSDDREGLRSPSASPELALSRVETRSFQGSTRGYNVSNQDSAVVTVQMLLDPELVQNQLHDTEVVTTEHFPDRIQ